MIAYITLQLFNKKKNHHIVFRRYLENNRYFKKYSENN